MNNTCQEGNLNLPICPKGPGSLTMEKSTDCGIREFLWRQPV